MRKVANPVGKQINQFTSPLVGVEKPWAELVAAGHSEIVREHLVAAGVKMEIRRSILSWLYEGAPPFHAGIASGRSIHRWRVVLRDLGPAPAPPKVEALGA